MNRYKVTMVVEGDLPPQINDLKFDMMLLGYEVIDCKVDYAKENVSRETLGRKKGPSRRGKKT